MLYRKCMSVEETRRRHDCDAALAECARAAVSWHSQSSVAEERLASLRRGMVWVARANGGKLSVRSVSEFLALLRTPTEWLPGVTETLADENGASEFARDIIAETGGP